MYIGANPILITNKDGKHENCPRMIYMINPLLLGPAAVDMLWQQISVFTPNNESKIGGIIFV
jgi:hypothetical protein